MKKGLMFLLLAIGFITLAYADTYKAVDNKLEVTSKKVYTGEEDTTRLEILTAQRNSLVSRRNAKITRVNAKYNAEIAVLNAEIDKINARNAERKTLKIEYVKPTEVNVVVKRR